MGEFHFSRYPSDQWEQELQKMKAGGINVVLTYVFWSFHEAREGHFDWSGNLNLRRFVNLCHENGLMVIVRIGPFCHGEIRNGALPDWLFAAPLEVRSDDPNYLFYVRRYFAEIGKQLKGLLYTDGGPVIGCQIENEMQHSASPWAIHYPDEPFDYTAASYDAQEASIGVDVQEHRAARAVDGQKHMHTLRRIAEESGISTPIYTVTGWGNAATLDYDGLPVTAGYTYPFWESTPRMSDFMTMKDLHAQPDYAPVRYQPLDFPSMSAEMGAGMQHIYRSRPIVTAEAAEALMVRTLGSGSNGIGYYVYHGGSTPMYPDGLTSQNDEPMGMPKISYDYQAPLGEFGLEGLMYRHLRLLHHFVNNYGSMLAPMQTVLPENATLITPQNRDDLRYCARMKDNSGFVFMVNFQDHDTARHDQTDLRISIKLNNGSQITIPQKGSFTLPKDASVILPFNMPIADARLTYATAQPLLTINDNGTPHHFFFSHDGLSTEYVFDKTTVRGKNTFRPKPGFTSTFTVKSSSGKTIRITTLTRADALNVAQIKGRLVITDALVAETTTGFTMYSLGKNDFHYIVYPSKTGFRQLTASTPQVNINPKIHKVGSQRMSVNLRNLPTASNVCEYFLQVDYTADVAFAFLDGRLVQDEFFHGTPWTIGLARHADQLKSKDMTFYFRPLRADAPFLRDLPPSTLPHFTKPTIVDIRQVKVIPQYQYSVEIK